MTDSTIDRRAGDRRAPTTQPMQQEASGWHLDKKVPLGLIFTILVQAGMVVWAIADIKKDVEVLKANQAMLAQQDVRQVTDLRDALSAMREQFTSVNAKLDRLIERQIK
jgi:hypothetical protein